MTVRERNWILAAAMLALFLGALDALVVSAAMPSIVAELGGLHLYSWVFTAYLLTRAVSLPIFGKLSDLFGSKRLFLISIVVFTLSSVLAGTARSMIVLILCRALQGIGAGGSFALSYIVVADVSPPEKRAKMMGLISFVWGFASVLGPPIGGFIVDYFSWPWIFYINVPLGILAFGGVFLYLRAGRGKKDKAEIDVLGTFTLSASILCLLLGFLLAGREYAWTSPPIAGLMMAAMLMGMAFLIAERRAKDPILPLGFFRVRLFTTGNGAAFFASFAIFALSSFSPMFIQGALGQSPGRVGIAMIPLSLGWSMGALLCGQVMKLGKEKPMSLLGGALLVAGSLLTLTFSTTTPLWFCSLALAVSGLGMGFVSISTLLLVQTSLAPSDLGVATSSHQFSRTLGGTVGIGLSGSFAAAHLVRSLNDLSRAEFAAGIEPGILGDLSRNVEGIFHLNLLEHFPAELAGSLQGIVSEGVGKVYAACFAASFVCLLFCLFLERPKTFRFWKRS